MAPESALKLGGVAAGDAMPLLMEEMVDELEQAKAWKAVDTVKISVDLQVAASQLMRLLRRVEGRGDLYKGPAVARAIRRYEQCWLTLAKELKPEEIRRLQPPLDVQWVWLCHRLNPEEYARDCEQICGRLVDGPLFAQSREEASSTLPPERDAEQVCRIIWDERFPEEGYGGEEWEAEARGEGERSKRTGATGGTRGAQNGSLALVPAGQTNGQAQNTLEKARANGRSGGMNILATPENKGMAGEEVPDLLTLSDSGSPGGKSVSLSATSSGQSVYVTPEQILPSAEGTSPSPLKLTPPPATQKQGQTRNGVAQANGVQGKEEEEEGVSWSSRLGYNLEEAVRRQAGFFFQVDRGCMRDPGYVRLSVLRYRMFLHLVRLNEGLFCVPTYDVDLLWHSHMMCAVAYRGDTMDLLGRVLGHDDSDAPTEEPSKDVKQRQQSRKRLDWAFRATAKVWDRTYGMAYDRAGGMHRGPRPSHKIAEGPEAVVAHAMLANLREASGASGVPMSALAAASSIPRAMVLGMEGSSQPMTIDKINSGKGLRPRIVFDAQIMLWGAMNLDPSPTENFSVTIGVMSAAPNFSLKSRPLQYKEGWPVPSWKQRWSLQCEVLSKGLMFELRADSDGFWSSMWGPRLVGSGQLEWKDVLKEPTLFKDTKIEMTSLISSIKSATTEEGSKKKLPALHVAVSVTPPEPGPYLLKMIFMRGTDDNGAMICQDMFIERDCKPQVGRWVSRTVLDHTDREAFVIRKRVAKGMWQGRHRPQAVHYRESVIVVHRGGWKYLETDPLVGAEADPPHVRVGHVPGPIIAQAVPMVTADLATERTYVLIDCLEGDETATLSVRRDPGAYIFVEGIHITLTMDSKMPIFLKPGRHMQYEVEGATHSEELGYATLIRFAPDCPRGRATALLNWKGATFQVNPGESVMLAMLLCVCIGEAINDMVGVNRVRRFRRIALPDYDPTNHWEAVADRPYVPSVRGSNPDEEHEYVFASVEKTLRHWWNRRPPTWHAGAGSCGAGACGPSIVS